jgi:hypothetical protein
MIQPTLDDRSAPFPADVRDPRATSLELAALAAALGVTNTSVLRDLYAHGLRASTAVVLEWVPAVDVCWLDGADAGERNALRVQLAADDRATVEGVALLDAWLTSRPVAEFFEAGRQAIRLRLKGLDDAAREATLDRIVAICEAAGRAGGGAFGVSALSKKERRHIEAIRRDLELPD